MPAECLPDEEEDEDEAGPMVEVWRKIWPSVMFFLACETQWRVAATMDGLIWLGIDYVAADVILRHRGRAERQDAPNSMLLADLAFMEAVAAPILNEARS